MIACERFGLTKNGEEVLRYTLENGCGMSVSVLTYGCAIQRILVPDRSGAPVDVALGYDDLLSYEKGICLYGAVVGRYANRIKDAEFTLNGVRYQLEKNLGGNHLHGCFPRRVFEAQVCSDTLVLSYLSPDGEDGFPGDLRLEVRYRLTEENALEIEYAARTDRDTVLNLTNHTYFNLDGCGNGDVLGHLLRLDSDSITEPDASSTPTGKILGIAGTPFDFRTEKAVGAEIFSEYPLLAQSCGYDHNYILKGAGELREFASVRSRESGIVLTCATTQPAVQLYTGNFIGEDPVPCGKNGVRYGRYAGLCLETQHYPASPNFPHFPTTVLRRGEEFFEKTVYRFDIE